MCADLCADSLTGPRAGMCTEKRARMRTDMCTDMCYRHARMAPEISHDEQCPLRLLEPRLHISNG